MEEGTKDELCGTPFHSFVLGVLCSRYVLLEFLQFPSRYSLLAYSVSPRGTPAFHYVDQRPSTG
jgi:hypothetical protein